MLTGVRKSGAVMLAVGAAMTAILAGAAVALNLMTHRAAVWVVAVPVAVALAGVAQLATGVNFMQMASRWDSLQGWQRGVLGVLVVVAFIALLFLIFLTLLAMDALPGV